MLTVRDEGESLIVDADSRAVRVLVWLFGLGLVAAWVLPLPRQASAGWSLVCLIFGVALLAATERSRFVFDRRSRLVRWRKTTGWRTEAGEVAFDSIQRITVERDFVSAAPSRGRGGGRRLVLLTATGPVPFTSAFTGWGTGIEETAEAIERFLRR